MVQLGGGRQGVALLFFSCVWLVYVSDQQTEELQIGRNPTDRYPITIFGRVC